MALRERRFTDLIIMAEEGRGLLKGVPGLDQQLVPVDAQDEQEISDLLTALKDKYDACDERCDPDTGQRRPSDTFRFEFESVRYRVAAFNNVDKAERIWFLRRLAESVPDIETLGLPPELVSWLLAKEQSQGLVLISGPQASGKTTTAASYIQARLRLYGGHAVTFECPVEMPLAGRHGEHGICFQRETQGEDQLPKLIENAHRLASPSIIHIGEIRTKFAATEALRVSLGSRKQLVVVTIHGLDVKAALERLMAWARELEGEAASQNLGDSLLAVIHQDLTLEDGVRRLRCPEFLLVPFNENFDGIRAKLRDGAFASLKNDMTQQGNLLSMNGSL